MSGRQPPDRPPGTRKRSPACHHRTPPATTTPDAATASTTATDQEADRPDRSALALVRADGTPHPVVKRVHDVADARCVDNDCGFTERWIAHTDDEAARDREDVLRSVVAHIDDHPGHLVVVCAEHQLDHDKIRCTTESWTAGRGPRITATFLDRPVTAPPLGDPRFRRARSAARNDLGGAS